VADWTVDHITVCAPVVAARAWRPLFGGPAPARSATPQRLPRQGRRWARVEEPRRLGRGLGAALQGPRINAIDNGLLLPTDVHRLVDRALPVVDPDFLEILLNDFLWRSGRAGPHAAGRKGGQRQPRRAVKAPALDKGWRADLNRSPAGHPGEQRWPTSRQQDCGRLSPWTAGGRDS